MDEGLFPEVYLLPVDDSDPTVTLKAVNHFITNGIKVEKVNVVNGKTYDAGTFVINMDQAKAG